MDIIPAIDLLNGKCVRLTKGNYNKVKDFSQDPLEKAVDWMNKGAKKIHIVDLDAARTGEPHNNNVISRIIHNLNIPIQIGGGIRSQKRASELLEKGVSKIILGTIAIEDPALVKDLSDQYPNRILVGIDALKEKVATRGWLENSNKNAKDLLMEFSSLNLAGFVITDIDKDGTLNGPNYNFFEKLIDHTSLPIIASGGVSSLNDLLRLRKYEPKGMEAVIVGKALYEKKFTLDEAQNLMNKKI
tara:strand:- start:19707 stop:20438 length:732 start_codon:yes stop_codon:yes gene_type:complete